MAKAKDKEVAVLESAEVPAYLQTEGPARGSEGVGTEDLSIPRLEIVQSLSPCRDKEDPAYIEGAEEGMLYNNVSRELYGNAVKIVPVIFKKEYLIWKDRKQGGGFRGSYDTMSEANMMIESLVAGGDDQDGSLEAIDTAQHLCLLIRDDGKIEEIAVSMSRSKMKVNRQWNTLIRMAGGDRFSRVYELKGIQDNNDKGDKFKNFGVKLLGFPSETVYRIAESLYNEIESGREINVNSDVDAPSESTDNGDTPAF